MAIPNRILMGAASVSAALAIGFVMQQGSDPQMRSAQSVALAASDRLELDDVTLTVASPIVDEAPAVVPREDEEILLAAAAPQIDAAPVGDSPALDHPARSCDPEMTTRALPAAMVELSLDAPCLSGQRVTIHHNGMMFTDVTDEQGRLILGVPALSQTAVFIADFGTDQGAVAVASVPDLAEFDRAVLQWRGATGLHLHAMEYGAEFGQDGHVWADRPGSVDLAVTGQGGFMSRLGDRDLPDGYRAEIYSFPTGSAARAGDIALSVDVEVTGANCRQPLNAEAVQLTGGTDLEVRELVLSMPQCDAVGDFLMLKNLLQDLKIAAN